MNPPPKGKTVNNSRSSSLSHKGFTGVEIFNEKVDSVFKGTSMKESFLLFNIISTDTGNYPIMNNTD